MVVTTTIVNWQVYKILINQGNSTDVLFWHTFKKLDIQSNLTSQYSKPLLGFVQERVHTNVYLDLLTTFETSKAYRIVMVRYLLVEVNTSYNILIGLNKLEVVVSTPYMGIKFLVKDNFIIFVIKVVPKEVRYATL